ncbi:hypothetical protein PHET_11129 [Paragonimus heterotremus]|uniref:Uncharacterized protein n=1 Tax=Paragonimus heterotremus TaxID=100268 RepID=A0A8J4WML4_9TREM|nr:hypothetical protein PHET_11129 [Paragonimus heterotremus]
MSSVVTDDGSDVIARTIVLTTNWRVPVNDVSTVFHIEETVQWIKNNGFNQIGLQFPDELLCVAAVICKQICEASHKFCFILGDSSFAGCVRITIIFIGLKGVVLFDVLSLPLLCSFSYCNCGFHLRVTLCFSRHELKNSLTVV